MQKQSKCRGAWILFFSFFLPAAVLLAVYAAFGMSPFGNRSILIMDMSDQYVEFYAGLKHIGQNGDWFFSWGKAMGGNYTGVFAYYLSSPFSFLVLLFPQEQITTALLIMNLLKIGCAGLAFSFFLRCRFQKWGGMYVAFAMAYALMSYNIVYSMCLMWLDGVIWLPVVLAGVDAVVRGKRPWLLFGSLAILFISNYYTSYMVVLFAVLYFLLRYFAEEEAPARLFPKKLGFCAVSVIGAAGIGAWLLVPTLCSLLQGKIGAASNAQVQTFNFDFSQLPAKFLPGVYDSITNSGLPSIFCGALVLVLVFCFFFHPQFTKRERMVSAGILAVLLISFWIGPIDAVWHVFQAPNWFPYRYAFVFGCFMIYLAARAFFSLQSMPAKKYGSAIVCWAVFCAGAYLLWKKGVIASLLLMLFAGGVYLVLLFFFRTGKQKQAGAFLLTAVFVLCGAAEFWFNGSKLVEGLNRQFGYQSEESYTGFQEQIEPLVNTAKEKANGTFFRMEKDFERSKNDAIGLGYNGITHYSSAYSRSMNSFLQDLGMSQAYFWDSYYGATPITDALFSVRYLMMRGDVCSWYSLIDISGDVTLYENPDVLSLAFAASGSESETMSFGNNPFQNQEALLKAAIPYEGSCWSSADEITLATENAIHDGVGLTGSFEKDGSSPCITYCFRTTEQGPVYAYFKSPTANSCAVSVNGYYVGVYFTNETRQNLYLGTFAKGEEVEISFAMRHSSLTISDVFVQTLKESFLRDQLQKLQLGQMQIESYSARKVTGTVTAEQNGFLFTSIPYDEGWTVKIDGVPTETSALYDTLLTVSLVKGTHRIEFSYSPAGLLPGVIITAVTVLFVGILLLFCLRKSRHSKK